MVELKDFIYELHRYANQTHTLKDKYEKLTESEKDMVMEAAPENLQSPDEVFHPVFQWLETMHNRFSVKDGE
ncbi:hypothetical protein QGM71_21525 [Virgibacillus sp. C22-A2]|uniref:Uncharacterized protein n=1 Tax=Virgibacillus tibetensis TaxID=3042313 RepID=A0ABU6KN32_9BACI|nr:hypothetical protein [Virgibacillus sp. C22-A2]